MSDQATADAPSAAPVAATPAPSAPITPPPHQVPGLLGITPTGAPSSPEPKASDPAPPAAPTPPASPSDAALDKPYFATLIEKNPELKAHEKTLARFQDIEADQYVPKLAKSYAELAKFKGVLVPGVEASPEDLANYRKVNGLPADAKDYKLSEAADKRFESLGVKDPALKAIYTEAAYKANLTPAQVDAFSEAHEKAISQLMDSAKGQSETVLKANVEALRKEQGDNFDAYLGQAQKLHEVAFVGAKLTEAEQADMNSFIKTTAYTKLLASLSTRIQGEASIHRGADGVFQSSQAKLESTRREILNNPKHPFNDHTHPEHHKALADFAQLQNEGKGWV